MSGGVETAITHVIFDVDGLLLDTERLYTQACQQLLDEFGHQFSWKLKSQMMGRSAVEAAEIIIKQLQLPLTVDQYISRSQQLLRQLFPSAQLMPGAERLVRHLYQQRIPIAVASGTCVEMYRLKTQRHQAVFNMFSHAVLSSSDPAVRHGKPAPDVFRVCASRFDPAPGDPRQVLVMEDAANGVKAALAADMRCVLVPDPRLEVSDLPDSGSLTVLSSLLQFSPEQYGLPAFTD